jgi:glutathionylspermidine synthase
VQLPPMEIKQLAERKDWEKIVVSQGFDFYRNDLNSPYWIEGKYVAFTSEQMEELKCAIQSLHDLCIKAVGIIVESEDLMKRMHIPRTMFPLIRQSWSTQRHMYIYGRFDLLIEEGTGVPKMLEYNADTPTSLLEAGSIQKLWAKDVGKIQFNEIEERLVERFIEIGKSLNEETLYFTCISQHMEDAGNTRYMMKCAEKAGITCKFIYIDHIVYASDLESFVDEQDSIIKYIWKLYPWEWLEKEQFFNHIDCFTVIEPAWKLILSNKCLLPMLYELFPQHKYLLPAYFTEQELIHKHDYVAKPIYGREGADIVIYKDGKKIESKVKLDYDKDGYIYQKFCESLLDNVVVGGWVVGDVAAGVSVRQDEGLVTTNTAHFLAHAIEEKGRELCSR